MINNGIKTSWHETRCNIWLKTKTLSKATFKTKKKTLSWKNFFFITTCLIFKPSNYGFTYKMINGLNQNLSYFPLLIRLKNKGWKILSTKHILGRTYLILLNIFYFCLVCSFYFISTFLMLTQAIAGAGNLVIIKIIKTTLSLHFTFLNIFFLYLFL